MEQALEDYRKRRSLRLLSLGKFGGMKMFKKLTSRDSFNVDMGKAKET